FWWTFWEGPPDIFIEVKTPEEGQLLGKSSTYKPTESGTTINLSVEYMEAGEVEVLPEEEKRYDVELALKLAIYCRDCWNEDHPNYFDFGSARGFTEDFDDGMVIAFQGSEYQDWRNTHFNAWKKPVSWLPAIKIEGDWWPVVP
ncbi:unnamed protein product, partial [marine sediment metagenome]